MPSLVVRFAACLIAAAAAAPAEAGGGPLVPRFVDETEASGIRSVYAGDWEYMVGGGVAAFDCSGDGFPDLVFAGGTAPARLYRNGSERGGPLRFQAVESGVELDRVTGVYPVDIDADDIDDIVLLRIGETVVMRGLGGCRFERANEAWTFEGGDAWTSAFSATFEAGSAWPTLAIGTYIDLDKGAMPWGNCAENRLHRPRVEGGRPARGFGPPVPLAPSHCALSMLFTDWNRSGIPSLRVSNDREYYKGGQEQLWRVEPGKPPALYTEAEGWKSLRIWGMGIAGADLDGDGFPEYFLTSMADNKLQTLADPKPSAAPVYKDVAFARGVTAHRPYVGGDIRPSTAWHADFQDVNNDGFADLFVAKGNVAEMPDFAAEDPNNLLLQAPDGTFVEAGDRAGVASTRIGRGGALVDLNLDGLVDLVVANRWKDAEIWRNTTAGAGHWLQIRLADDPPNRDAIGAWIEVRLADRIIRREVTIGGGHAGGQLGWWHFGLGATATPQVRVLWPDGREGPWQAVAGDSFQVIGRDGPPRPWTP
ncbi:CRTAC1 family protein [Chthonobacter rhizosphaerae]|uniref:CRTAC1 family protein n=1 Tax=Chthonobacter rhizosphaerae TaxID=2735553 RepID=UPI0015EF9273|nr:CRTAC1 family protein [Chthonobacter rhizosphaerae]